MNFTGSFLLTHRFEHYLNRAVSELMIKLYPDWAPKKNFYVSFYHIPNVERYK